MKRKITFIVFSLFLLLSCQSQTQKENSSYLYKINEYLMANEKLSSSEKGYYLISYYTERGYLIYTAKFTSLVLSTDQDFECATINNHFAIIGDMATSGKAINKNNPCVKKAMEEGYVKENAIRIRDDSNYWIFMFCENNPEKYLVTSYDEMQTYSEENTDWQLDPVSQYGIEFFLAKNLCVNDVK